ncbi:MAG: FAD-dependent oxidoreductase [Lachnospiraceae bacterium]
MEKYKNLFSPLKIRGKIYKNRIETAPTYFAFRIFDPMLPEVSENVYRMCEKRAQGGAAAVSIGESPINFDDGVSLFAVPFDYGKLEGKYFDGYCQYAKRIKEAGALAIAEVCHEGMFAMTDGADCVGPCEMIRQDGVHVRAMDEAAMQKCIGEFVQTARFMKAAGFDVFMIHGGHGFLLQQFLSPYFNHRTDEYGGDDENRARFPLRVIQAVREVLGEDMVLELRMSAQDGVPGGMKIEDTLEFYKMIDGIVDVIQISNGLKLKGGSTRTFTSMFDRHGYNAPFAKKVKDVVKESKVAVIGGINHPALAEQIISDGMADIVVLGRQAFADPEFPNKAKEGRTGEIRKCVRCHQCYPGVVEEPGDGNLPINQKDIGRCALNPKENFFFYPDRLPLPSANRRVLIIGGGVAGMQAALTCKERGHVPVIVEKKDHLGGTLCFTDMDPDKTDLHEFKETVIRQVIAAGIEVHLNTEADPQLVSKMKPDHIIVAVGAHPSKPSIPGIEYGIDALEAYHNLETIGHKVLLIGGGLVGCEVGLCLSGMGHEVTVAEMQERMAPEAIRSYRTTLFEEIRKRNMKLVNQMKCVEIQTDGAVFMDKNGNLSKITADTCIYSLGMIRNTLEFEETEIPVTYVGDCNQVGNVRTCITDAYQAALNIL